jgi:hypothetical protein
MWASDRSGIPGPIILTWSALVSRARYRGRHSHEGPIEIRIARLTISRERGCQRRRIGILKTDNRG